MVMVPLRQRPRPRLPIEGVIPRVGHRAPHADGSQQVPLTHFDVPYEAGDTNWSSDGKKIAFEYDINGMRQSDPNAYAEVWTMNLDGSAETSTKVQCSGVGCAPRWQPK